MFNWFGRKGAPEIATGYLPDWLRQRDGGVAFATGYEAQRREVYEGNPVGLRCVRLVAEAVGGLSYHAAKAEAEKLVAGPLMEQAAAALLLHGNAYVQLIVDEREAPRELALLRPERVSVACDGRGQPSALVYRGGRAAVTLPLTDALLRRQAVHIRSLNPGDDHYGLGCLAAATPAASIHNQASRWNKALLDNAARPSGAMTFEPADGSSLSAEQFERLREELDQQFAGAGNAGRPLLLDGGLKWQPMAMSPADMDFIALKESAARDIALAFGVPPVLVGLPGDATYANAREAGRALYRQTVFPLARRILNALDALLGDWMDGPPGLAFDPDLVTELAEDRALLWEQVSAADFLSREEKRAQLGFGASFDTPPAAATQDERGRS
jgi:HK97 family phage portal protein